MGDWQTEVASLLQEAASTLIAPRHRRLQQGDVEEKSPGEWVTQVDRDVEVLLTPALQRLLPGSRVVGEEAVASNPALLDALDAGTVWLVDPLDGTVNFIEGRPEVAVMVALLREGETVAAWMLDPLQGTLHAAERGAGAWRDGERVRCAEASSAGGLRGIVKTRFLPPDLKQQTLARAAALRELQKGVNAAGAEYPAIVRGESDFALYWRTLPWDHAPGALFLAEAGGHVARLDGTPYRPHERREGLLAATSRDVWDNARVLLGF